METLRGLSKEEAQQRLKRYGCNEIPHRIDPWYLRLLKKLTGPIPLMIEVAALLSAILGKWEDFTIIITLLIVNIFVDFFQENKAMRALEALRSKLAKRALVLRDGAFSHIDARLLVPGDVIKVRLGDIVPADVTLLKTAYLEVDQSALTGESMAVTRHEGESVYGNSVVTKGEALAKVTTTGARAYIGRTAQLVVEAEKEEVSHFQRTVQHIGKFLIALTAVLAILVAAVALSRGDGVLETVRFILVLIIASIPVALPAVLSVTMAVGAVAISRMQAIVRNISAIEELASTDVLCTDKTGTLTENKMTVAESVTYYDFSEQDLFAFALLASNEEDHDPIEVPLFLHYKEHFSDDYFSVFTRQSFVPFDPIQKISQSHVLRGSEPILIIKGAPQVIMERIEDDAVRYRMHNEVRTFAQHGFRTLAVAARFNQDEHFTPIGLISLYDPPRKDSKQVIREVRNMGITIKMLTGDNREIATYIAEMLDIGSNVVDTKDLRTGNTYKEYALLGSIVAREVLKKLREDITEEDANRFGNKIAQEVRAHLQEAHLEDGVVKKHESDIVALIEEANAFCEVLPEDKYLIIDKLQKNNHIVAMTGDGVNDAPALKKADVGIAVSGATETARAAADLVLLAPGLSVIRHAIRIARITFERMKGYATFRIAETIRIVLFITISIILLNFYPVTAIMIIILALLNDIPVMMIAYDNAPENKTVMRWNMREVLTVSMVLGVAGVISSFALFYWLYIHEYPIELIQAILFLKLDVAGHSTLYLTRTGRHHFWHKPYPSLKFFIPAFTTRILGTLIAVYGIFMAPVGWEIAAYVWIYAFGWWLCNDVLKVFTYKIMDRQQAIAMDYSEKRAIH